MFKNGKFLIMIFAICFLMGTFRVVVAKGLPADVEKWLKKNKIGPYQEDKADYKALYKAAKKEGKVVVYSSTSRGPKSLSLGFYKKYPGIKVEWNTIPVYDLIRRFIREQKAGIYYADVIAVAGYPMQRAVLSPSNMVFPWVPPDLKKVIPQEYQEPLLFHRFSVQSIFYNYNTWPDKPPVDSWWDVTRPKWKGRLVGRDPRTNASGRHLYVTIVLNAEEMAKDYERVFGKPLKLTTPNAGYEWIKMVLANKIKFVKSDKNARYIGKPGQAKPSLGVSFEFARITDAYNPKYGVEYGPNINLKPRVGMMYPLTMSMANKAPRPNGAKLLIRWLFGDEKGGGGNAPWFTPGILPARSDVKDPAPHPFNPDRINWNMRDLKFWVMDGKAVWEKQQEVVDFIIKHHH
jgi:iron(III) transport system substrate-binding protein